VSLIPAVTEIICEIGASGALVGVTYNDFGFEGTAGKAIAGGASSPRFDAVSALSPDLLIVSPEHHDLALGASGGNYPVFVMGNEVSLREAKDRTRKIGEIFARGAEAEDVIRRSDSLIETIRLKVEKIPRGARKKAVFLSLGPEGLLVPGDSSFRSEMIRLAGGVTGSFGEGRFVPVTPEHLSSFDPDFIFTNSSEYGEVMKLLEGDGWKDLRALRGGRLYSFPEAITGRAAAHVGYFAAWLSSEIYADEFADAEALVHPREILGERVISLDIPYVRRARIVEIVMMDFVGRTLLVDFKRPQHIVSTAFGERDGVTAVGNSYAPVPTWSVFHRLSFEKWQEDLFEILGLDPGKTDVMLTGADMNNASVKTASFRDMTVTAIVTGGVEGNSLRTSKDAGAWYEPGTINILVMTNHRLSEQAATRAVITATEAKTAALWDMDIRSAQNRAMYPATGTGTDTVIIVSGEGVSLNWSGGHSKMGELIADAVYRGVQEALLKQNGKARARNPIERLEERGIYLRDFGKFQAGVEEILLSPRYKNARGFLESAFSLSDAHVMGQISDTGAFEAWALGIAGDISGRQVERIEDLYGAAGVPAVLDAALDAICTGLKLRED
jgi:adenosylcobinamide amidohydrolase/ABC-type Fe3+-hydroxamate transport system substrate-binding protein